MDMTNLQLQQIVKRDPALATQTLAKLSRHPQQTKEIITSAMKVLADHEREKSMSEEKNANGQPAPVNLGEAPASATCKMTSPQGVEWLLTARDATVAGLMDKVSYMEDYLLRHDWQPAGTRHTAGPATNANGSGASAPVCPYHGPMKASTKVLGTFYCSSKMADGSYCKEKSP